jgi:hypothetical protein
MSKKPKMRRRLAAGGARLMYAYPTEREIRAALMARMEAFCAATGQGPSIVSRTVMKDTSFYYRKVIDGGNFTVGSYQRFHDHFDKHWPRKKRSKKS